MSWVTCTQLVQVLPKIKRRPSCEKVWIVIIIVDAKQNIFREHHRGWHTQLRQIWTTPAKSFLLSFHRDRICENLSWQGAFCQLLRERSSMFFYRKAQHIAANPEAILKTCRDKFVFATVQSLPVRSFLPCETERQIFRWEVVWAKSANNKVCRALYYLPKV